MVLRYLSLKFIKGELFPIAHSPAGELEMRKNLSKDFKGATRMALMRALKWAPTWYVSADISTFISYPDLIQRLAIKGISGVSPDLSSGGSFCSSHWGDSHGTLEHLREGFFLQFEFPSCRTVIILLNHNHISPDKRSARSLCFYFFVHILRCSAGDKNNVHTESCSQPLIRRFTPIGGCMPHMLAVCMQEEGESLSFFSQASCTVHGFA